MKYKELLGKLIIEDDSDLIEEDEIKVFCNEEVLSDDIRQNACAS